MRALAVLLLVGACGGEIRRCSRDEMCVLPNGGRGFCVEEACAFDDPSCASGLRWDDRSENRNLCVPGPDAAIDAPDASELDAGDDAVAPPPDGMPDGSPDGPVDATSD